MKKTLRCILFLAILIFIFSCAKAPATTPETTGGTPTGGTGGSATGGLGIKTDVEISGFAFAPATVTIPVRTTVLWTNKDSARHTIVSDSGNEISSNEISQGNTYAHTFDTAGTYSYHCSIHPLMKGTVIVE